MPIVTKSTVAAHDVRVDAHERIGYSASDARFSARERDVGQPRRRAAVERVDAQFDRAV
jgi:hypothetical protein